MLLLVGTGHHSTVSALNSVSNTCRLRVFDFQAIAARSAKHICANAKGEMQSRFPIKKQKQMFSVLN